MEITYEDVAEAYETRTKFGFLIEDEVAMAERNLAVFHESGADTEIPKLNPALEADSLFSGPHNLRGQIYLELDRLPEAAAW